MCNWKLVCSCIGAAVFVTGCILGWVVFPNIIENEIIEGVVIREGTDQFERWVELPQPMHFMSYVFNLTNPDEVLKGEKPIVQEIGPYIYKQHRKRRDVSFSDNNNLVESRQYQFYEFDARASAPYTLDDRFTTVAMHVNGIFEFVEHNVPDLLPILPLVMDEIFGVNSIFIETTPREFLFEGVRFCTEKSEISSLVCGMIAAQAPKTIRVNDDGSLSFSMYGHKVDTHDGLFEMHTGENDIFQTAEINRWESKDILTTWPAAAHGDFCNMINGTDGSFFRPFRNTDSENLYVFNTDVCRSSEMQYHSEDSYEGIPALKFVVADSMLKTPDTCFCTDTIIGSIKQENGCLYSGALDLSACLEAPVVMTFPHFLDTATEYSSLVEGLTPNRDLHETLVLVEPNTGNPVVGHKRAQFNMFIRPIPGVDIVKDVKTTLMPIVWVDEGIRLNEEMVDMLKTTLINRLVLVDALHWTLFSVGLAAFLGFGIWWACTLSKR